MGTFAYYEHTVLSSSFRWRCSSLLVHELLCRLWVVALAVFLAGCAMTARRFFDCFFSLTPRGSGPRPAMLRRRFRRRPLVDPTVGILL